MRFIHKQNGGHKGGLTVGYILDDAERRAVVTMARCSSEDQFSKPKGRLICENRYAHGMGFLLPVDPQDIHGSILTNLEKTLKRLKA